MVSAVKTGRNLLGGAIGAFLGWMIVEPIPWLTSDGALRRVDWTALSVLGMIVGCMMGLGLGAAEGINSGSYKQLLRSTALGLLIGLAGGLIGVNMGQMIYGAIAGPSSLNVEAGLLDFFLNIIARTLGWAMWGVVIGASQGVSSGSLRRIWLGAIGGVIGGATGGFVFELLGYLLGGIATGEVLRLTGFVSVGAGIGLFSSLGQEMFKQAWVRLLAGRGEGREFQIAKPISVIGRDELADIPLFGDNQIAKRHVLIQQMNGLHTASAAQAGLAFAVNGQMVASAPLKDGDIIRVGTRELEFHERVGRQNAVMPSAASVRTAAPTVDVPIGSCPFCGQVKDAYGNCGCTVDPPQSKPLPQPVGAEGTVSSGMVTLQVISGPLSGQSVIIKEGQSIGIGRAAEADMALQGDSFVSRQHARLSVESGTPIIQDQGSSNGTFVNGTRVSRQILSPGDVIAIGQTQIRIA